jgi:long-chain fatty acid adenylyltransferase FadD28
MFADRPTVGGRSKLNFYFRVRKYVGCRNLHPVTQIVETSLPALLRERASLQPDDVAYTYLDFERDWAGVPVRLTWPQVYRRTMNVAHELRRCAVPGDRALIVAPQGLEYIVAFLGALEAGLIPVRRRDR